MRNNMYIHTSYIIWIVAPTFVRESRNFSASSFAMSAFTTAGALSTNFLAYFYTGQLILNNTTVNIFKDYDLIPEQDLCRVTSSLSL